MSSIINFENRIFNNILSEEEIDFLYQCVNECEEEQILPNWGQIIFKNKLISIDSKHPTALGIFHKVSSLMSNHYGTKVKLLAFQIARYTKKTGYVPKLNIHVDEIFDNPMVTLDIQINSNKQWGIFVEGEEFILNNNQALTFAGTHQPHWRPICNFEDEDYLDMAFIHFVAEDIKISDVDRNIIFEKTKKMSRDYNLEMSTIPVKYH